VLSPVKRYTDKDLPFIDGNPKIYVCLGGQFGLITTMFAQIGFAKAKTIEEADLIVYGGGNDVSPSFYNQKPILQCGWPDKDRDNLEKQIFEKAVELGIPQMGICRGAQFLHVMCGGSLWQHVNNHTKSHMMFDITSNVLVYTSSTHHQMMQFNEDMTLLACCDDDVATFFKDELQTIDYKKEHDVQLEVEVCSYEKYRTLCIQGHPEYGPLEFTSWSLHLLKDWFTVNRKENN